MQGKKVLVFHDNGFQLTTPYHSWKMTETTNKSLFNKLHSGQRVWTMHSNPLIVRNCANDFD